MARDTNDSRFATVGRGLRGRCPRCGSGGIFKGITDLKEDCPTCGLHFERESGYWLGSMIVIMAMVLGVFGLVTVGGILVTWPDVPWTGLMFGGIGANVIVPFLGYGWAKSVWMGIDRGLNPPAVAES